MADVLRRGRLSSWPQLDGPGVSFLLLVRWGAKDDEAAAVCRTDESLGAVSVFPVTRQPNGVSFDSREMQALSF